MPHKEIIMTNDCKQMINAAIDSVNPIHAIQQSTFKSD